MALLVDSGLDSLAAMLASGLPRAGMSLCRALALSGCSLCRLWLSRLGFVGEPLAADCEHQCSLGSVCEEQGLCHDVSSGMDFGS